MRIQGILGYEKNHAGSNEEIMGVHLEPSKPERPSWGGDVWGGLAAMLVALPSSVAFGVLIYSALGPGRVGEGALAGMLGAALIGLVAPLAGGTRGLISTPCAPAAAVLSTLAVSLPSHTYGNAGAVGIPALLALTVLLSSLLQIGYGIIGGGRLIKFIPSPVVSGYLSGVGLLIALGQLPKLFGFPSDMPVSMGLFSPGLWRWPGLAVGLVTMAVMEFAPRFTKKIPAAILGLLAGILTYFCVALFYPELWSADGNPIVIGPIQTSGTFLGAVAARVSDLWAINYGTLLTVLVPALTLSLLLSIDTLKTCVVLDALTHGRHQSNRELIGQGIGNLSSCLAGGIPGAGAMGPTLVNLTSGGRSRRSGFFEGVFVVLTLLLLSRWIAWLPIGALAGILLMVAWRMFDKSMFRLWRHPGAKVDLAVILGVIAVAVWFDLIAASGFGVVLSILLFIRDQMRGSVIRRKRYLNEVSSKTHRLAAEHEILAKHGGEGVFCELQGNLFFGTTDQLFSQLEPDLRAARFLLLDMRRVQSMDYTAAHLLEQMREMLAERGGRLLFSGMPSALFDQRDFEYYLAQLGVVIAGSDVMVSDTLDGALEWMEDRILEEAGAPEKNKEKRLEIHEIDLFRGFDENTLSALAQCMRERKVAPGERVFSQGDQSDEMFFVRRGAVNALLPLEGGKRHHLATFGRGDFFGEFSFLDRGKRSADVEAKVPTDLYALSRALFDAQIQSHNTAVSSKFFARLALAIANLLRKTDAELRMLEER